MKEGGASASELAVGAMILKRLLLNFTSQISGRGARVSNANSLNAVRPFFISTCASEIPAHSHSVSHDSDPF